MDYLHFIVIQREDVFHFQPIEFTINFVSVLQIFIALYNFTTTIITNNDLIAINISIRVHSTIDHNGFIYVISQVNAINRQLEVCTDIDITCLSFQS